MSDFLQQKAKLWLLQVFWGDAGQKLPGKRSISSSVGKVTVALVGAVCAAFALAADAVLIELTGLAAVMHPNLRGVEL